MILYADSNFLDRNSKIETSTNSCHPLNIIVDTLHSMFYIFSHITRILYIYERLNGKQ